MIKRTSTFLAILAIILSLFANVPSPSYARTEKISNFNIWYFKPSQVSTSATYKVLIDINETVGIHGWLKVTFPPEWTMPDVPPKGGYSEYWDHELERILTSIYIGTSPCTKCQGLPEIKTNKRKNPEFIEKFGLDNENSILFRTHIQLDPNGPYDPVPITIADRAGFTNAPEPGYYKVGISTEAEPDVIFSNALKVVRSQVSPANVTLTNPAIGEASGYNILFNVGEGGSIDARESRVTVVFPKTTKLPATIDPPLIKVNGMPLSVDVNIHQLSSTMSFITPVSVENSGKVDVQISEKAGIINSPTRGSYQVKIYTNFEPTIVDSNPYEIKRAGQKPAVDPPYASQIADYKFSVEIGNKLQENDSIEVFFPKGTTVNQHIQADSVLVDGTPCKLKPRVVIDEFKVLLYAPKVIQPGGVMIEFTKASKIRNPEQPGSYAIKFTSQGSDGVLTTDEYSIIIKRITIDNVSVKPINAKAIATWVIEGSLAFTGDLDSGSSFTLTFPNTTVIPENIPSDSMTINGVQVQSATGSGNVLTIQIPSKIQNGGAFKIVISPTSGIVSPETSSTDYKITMITSKDQQGGESVAFFIAPPIPETTLLIKPPQPDGKNGWFIHPPSIDFVCTSKTATIKVWWNWKKDQYIKWEPGNWSPLADAQRIDTLYWYAEDTYGTEELKSYDFKIDTIAPTFNITYPVGDTVLTRENTYKIAGIGDSTELAMYEDTEKLRFVVPNILINGKQVPIVQPDPKGDTTKVPNAGYFESIVTLNEGKNVFTIVAEDDAGNSQTKQVTIIKDTIAPQASIIKPGPAESSHCNTVEIQGKTEPEALVSVGSQIIQVEPDGMFYYDYQPKKFGANEVSFEIVDQAGNKTTLKYTIWWGTEARLWATGDGKQPNINGAEPNPPLPTTPYISKGNTFVPLRYLAEKMMGGTVAFDTLKKPITITLPNGTIITHTIGKNTFTKTEKGKKQVVIMMPIASENNKGSVFLPMRKFIEDGLGQKVEWNGALKQITVIIPPDSAKCKK